ncbi:MAG: class I SAM-dependent methyltransferase [Bacteroidia bacterium]|nr:class I SAM-dependent methyltransferase [Bacteroidia bacterium]
MKESIQEIAKKHIQNHDYLGWFEEVYQKGKSEGLEIPWVSPDPNPLVKEGCENLKLNGADKRALVIGCGLGEDAEYLSNLGFTVDAFDFSPTAIEWCKEIYSQSKANYFVADLMNLPVNVKDYDFVLEIYTLQTLPEENRGEAICILPNLIQSGGQMLLICRIRDEDEITEGVPFPLTLAEFSVLNECLSLDNSEILLSETDQWKRLRAVYSKP